MKVTNSMRRRPKVGELWVKYEGANPFEVTHINVNNSYGIKYLRTGQCFYGQKFNPKWVPYEEETKQKEETMAAKKLYQIIGEDVFGEHIATNCLGHYVIEIKGTSQIRVLPKGSVEEVFPYTVEVNIEGSKYAFLADKGSVEVGDIVIRSDEPYTGTLMVVTALGTKSSKATKRLTGTLVKGVKVS